MCESGKVWVTLSLNFGIIFQQIHYWFLLHNWHCDDFQFSFVMWDFISQIRKENLRTTAVILAFYADEIAVSSWRADTIVSQLNKAIFSIKQFYMWKISINQFQFEDSLFTSFWAAKYRHVGSEVMPWLTTVQRSFSHPKTSVYSQ